MYLDMVLPLERFVSLWHSHAPANSLLLWSSKPNHVRRCSNGICATISSVSFSTVLCDTVTVQLLPQKKKGIVSSDVAL